MDQSQLLVRQAVGLARLRTIRPQTPQDTHCLRMRLAEQLLQSTLAAQNTNITLVQVNWMRLKLLRQMAFWPIQTRLQVVTQFPLIVMLYLLPHLR